MDITPKNPSVTPVQAKPTNPGSSTPMSGSGNMYSGIAPANAPESKEEKNIGPSSGNKTGILPG